MSDDIGSGLSSMAVCFHFRPTNIVQLSNRNPYFYGFRCHHPLITQLRGGQVVNKSQNLVNIVCERPLNKMPLGGSAGSVAGNGLLFLLSYFSSKAEKEAIQLLQLGDLFWFYHTEKIDSTLILQTGHQTGHQAQWQTLK